MLYNSIRIFFWILVFVLLFLILRRFKKKDNRFLIFISLIAVLIGYSLTKNIPFENFFITFPTSQEAFRYKNIGEIENIIEGNESCLIIYSTGSSSSSFTILPKIKEGYKLETDSTYKTISTKKIDRGAFEIYHVNNTSDYYISGYFNTKENEINLTDSINSNFINIIYPIEASEYKTVLAYTHVNHLDSNYYIMLNGNKVIFEKIQ